MLAGRRPAAVAEAADRIRDAHPAASVGSVTLDLADLGSVAAAAAALAERHPRIDLLVNNAGVMATPAGSPSGCGTVSEELTGVRFALPAAA